jgi:hypothetical protein
MVSLQDKILVAQNCDAYRSKTYMLITPISYIAQNCSQCINYTNGKCIKELFKQIEEKIKVN